MISRILLLLGGLTVVVTMSPSPLQAQATTQGDGTNCSSCENDVDIYGYYHRFTIFADHYVDPNTGHGPHSTWKDYTCDGSHGRCYWEDEDAEALVELAESGDWASLRAAVTDLGDRAAYDAQRGELRIALCSGQDVVLSMLGLQGEGDVLVKTKLADGDRSQPYHME